MPIWGRRGHYPLTAGTVVIIVGVAAMTGVCRSIIPPPELGPTANRPGDFVRSSARLPIAWRTLDDDPFAEARRRELPLLFVMGSDLNQSAVAFDKWMFKEREIIQLIQQSFVPVRVDLDEDPAMVNAFWPLSRSTQVPDLGFQIWAVDANGVPRDFHDPILRGDRFDPAVFVLRLRRMSDRAQSKESNPVAARQATDLAILSGSTEEGVPDIELYLRNLQARVHPEYGGLPLNGFQLNAIRDWRMLQVMGRLGEFDAPFQKWMQSPLIDWTFGGIYQQAEQLNYSAVELDKRATLSAEFVAVLAGYARQTGDGRMEALARDQWKQVQLEFVREDRIVPWVSTLSSPLNRSARLGLTPDPLGRLTPEQEALGLDVGSNPQLIPRWTNPQDHEAWLRALQDLRKQELPAKTRASESAYLSSTALFVTSILEARRYLGESDSTTGVNLWAYVKEFEAGPDSVTHRRGEGKPPRRTLLDRAAYLLAACEVATHTGNEGLMRRGLAVFRQTRREFAPVYGAAVPDPRLPETLAIDRPDVVDGLQEASLPLFARATTRLSMLLPDAERKVVRDELRKQLGRESLRVDEAGQRLAGRYRAWWRLQSPLGYLIVGPDPQRWRDELGRDPAGPPLLWVQAWPGLKPGIYVVRDDVREGPFTSLASLTEVRP